MSLRTVTLTDLPLCQFKEGQRLGIKFIISAGRYGLCPAEFICLESHFVKVKCLDGWEPDYYSKFNLENKYPNRIARVMAKNCFLWGKGSTDTYDRCFWFDNRRTPAK